MIRKRWKTKEPTISRKAALFSRRVQPWCGCLTEPVGALQQKGDLTQNLQLDSHLPWTYERNQGGALFVTGAITMFLFYLAVQNPIMLQEGFRDW